MLKGLVNYFRGSVRLEVTGAFPERFLNLCAQRGIPFWDVEWMEQTCLRLTVTRRSGREAETLGERVLCTVTPAKQAGMPYFLGRFRRRYALLAGLALSLAAVGILSRFVLTIDVAGNERVPTAEILTELRRQGLRLGVYGPGVEETALIQRALLQLPELAWMTINLHGTRAEVLVREAIPKGETDGRGEVGSVVAEAPGIITHLEALEGDARVVEGDTVVVGDVLISGNVRPKRPLYGGGTEPGYTQVRAAGRVYARTWRALTAEIPLEAEVKAYTGEEKTLFSLSILGHRIIFYGNSGISTAGYDKISNTWTAALPNGQEMPLALNRETLRAYTTEVQPIDPVVAEELLKAQLEAALRAALGDGEVIATAYTTAQRDGMMRVTLQAECREEIGRLAPLEPAPPLTQEPQPES